MNTLEKDPFVEDDWDVCRKAFGYLAVVVAAIYVTLVCSVHFNRAFPWLASFKEVWLIAACGLPGAALVLLSNRRIVINRKGVSYRSLLTLQRTRFIPMEDIVSFETNIAYLPLAGGVAQSQALWLQLCDGRKVQILLRKYREAYKCLQDLHSPAKEKESADNPSRLMLLDDKAAADTPEKRKRKALWISRIFLLVVILNYLNRLVGSVERPSGFVAAGLLWYLCFLISTVCHEGAHALSAKWGGDLTAFRDGQVTLNPVPHIRREPLGLVLVPILSYLYGGWMIGWASAPYDPKWRAAHPRRAAWMALAGPLTNLLLALAAGAAIHWAVAAGHFQRPIKVDWTRLTELSGGGANFATSFLSVMFLLNVLLATLNLLPLPPFDGSLGVTLLFPRSLAERYAAFSRSRWSLLGLVAAWFLFGKIFEPVFLQAFHLLYRGLLHG